MALTPEDTYFAIQSLPGGINSVIGKCPFLVLLPQHVYATQEKKRMKPRLIRHFKRLGTEIHVVRLFKNLALTISLFKLAHSLMLDEGLTFHQLIYFPVPRSHSTI